MSACYYACYVYMHACMRIMHACMRIMHAGLAEVFEVHPEHSVIGGGNLLVEAIVVSHEPVAALPGVAQG